MVVLLMRTSHWQHTVADAAFWRIEVPLTLKALLPIIMASLQDRRDGNDMVHGLKSRCFVCQAYCRTVQYSR